MGTNTIPQATSNTVIPASDHNAIRTALSEDLVPRNSSAVATSLAGSLGTSALRWLYSFASKFYVGTAADNISIEADTSDCIIKVGGTERARIPQSVGLLPAGIIVAYSGVSDPAEWLICDGREVSRTTYSRLYAAIANTYGEGNGTTTFNLPDLRGRFLRGTDDPGNGTGAAGNDPDAASRTAMATGGNTANNVGSIQGDAFAAHVHTLDPFLQSLAYQSGSNATAWNPAASNTYDTNSTGTSTETRPKNANVNFIIKI